MLTGLDWAARRDNYKPLDLQPGLLYLEILPGGLQAPRHPLLLRHRYSHQCHLLCVEPMTTIHLPVLFQLTKLFRYHSYTNVKIKE